MLPTLERVAGAAQVLLIPKVTGSEDFSFFQHVVPGLFFFVGITPTDAGPGDGAAEPLAALLHRRGRPAARRARPRARGGRLARGERDRSDGRQATHGVGTRPPRRRRPRDRRARRSAPARARARRTAPPTLAIPSSHARIGYEQIRFPGDGPRVGVVGTSYLIDVGGVERPRRSARRSTAPSAATTAASSASAAKLAWRHRLVGPVGVELGLYAGGGGGGGAPQGSGLMLRPHVDLVWDLGAVAVGASFSKVRFNGGQIDSNQVGLVLNINSDFRFIPAERLGEPTLGGGRAGLGFDRIQFIGGAYRTPEGKTLNDGTPLPRTINTIGVRAEHAVGGNALLGPGSEPRRARRRRRLCRIPRHGRPRRRGDSRRAHRRCARGRRHGRRRRRLDRRRAARQGRRLRHRPARQRPRPLARGRLRLGAGRQLPRRRRRRSASSGRSTGRRAAGRRHGRRAPTSASAANATTRRAATAASARSSAVALKLDRYLTPNFYITGKVLGAAGGGASGYTSALVGAGWMQPLGVAPARRRRAARRRGRRRRRRRRRRARRAARLRRRADHADARPARRRRAHQGDRRPR